MIREASPNDTKIAAVEDSRVTIDDGVARSRIHAESATQRGDDLITPSTAMDSEPQTVGSGRLKGPFLVDMGIWPVRELQICEMGSKGPEGEYLNVGSISPMY